ncbi:flagellar protein FlgN [Thiomicrorhabdus arctica]|uniref:flagellar protein FlgN n=1 Tax=Thiomicrorhabdus arctica TaxID=131540 RepID=UPI00035DE5EC|nr:flagellar protein FlgN [Thiomicrorhabdus arctica]
MIQTDNIQNKQQLTSLVAELIRLFERFYISLQTESEALKKNNSEQLILTSATKQEQLEEIATMTAALELSLKASKLTLSNLFELNTPTRLPKSLQEAGQKLVAISDQCQDLNQANGMTIQILSNINNHALNLISGKAQPNIQLYGSSGTTTTALKAKTSLGKA